MICSGGGREYSRQVDALWPFDIPLTIDLTSQQRRDGAIRRAFVDQKAFSQGLDSTSCHDCRNSPLRCCCQTETPSARGDIPDMLAK